MPRRARAIVPTVLVAALCCLAPALVAAAGAPATRPAAVVRLAENPIIRPEMLPGHDGQNINGPSLIRVPEWIGEPLGRYYLYFAHHNGAYIRLAYADRLDGPWKVHAPGVLHLKDVPAARGHVASPDVHVDAARRQVRMYFHAPAARGGGQMSFVATSSDGLNFTPSDEPLGLFYFRAFPCGEHWYALAKGGELYRSRDGLTGFERGGNPFPAIAGQDRDHNRPGSVRHLALHRRGDALDVYYTRIGDAPESILRSGIDLRPDWRRWKASEPQVVLRPELPYEGADLPVRASRAGAVRGRENALRDPAILVEGDRTYLLYSVAGESGIAIAELAATATGQAWPRHTIESGLRGADGARPADVNGDGRLDLVVGWEQSGIVAAYLNPGPERARQPWPKAHFPGIADVEDAVFVDLDADGAADIVSSCEGKTRRVFIHWAPKDKADYLDASKWTVEAFPATVGGEMWMFCLPMQVDGKHGVDLVLGSKGKGAGISWLQAPADPRDLAAWKLHRLSDAGWIMSILGRDMDGDGDADLLISDRQGPLRGVRWLENPGVAAPEALARLWPSRAVGAAGEHVLFLDAADVDGDGLADVVVAQTDRCTLFHRQDRSGLRWRAHPIPLPERIGGGKAVTLGDLDRDGRTDLVLTCESAGGRAGKSGIVWLSAPAGLATGPWSRHEVSGPQGIKYDLAPLLDLDGDGDLDIVTTEESEDAAGGKGGLGVVWYENPGRR